MGQASSSSIKYGGIWLAGVTAGVLLCKLRSNMGTTRKDGMPSASQACTFLNCSSLDDSIEFYQNVLGLEMVYEQKGFVAFFRTTADSFICVCKRENREQDFVGDTKGAIVSLIFTSNNEVEVWHDKLVKDSQPDQKWSIEKTPGVGVSSDGKEVPQIFNMFLRDPAGYLVEFEVLHIDEWPTA